MDYLKNQFGYQVKAFENNQLVDFTNQPVSNFFFV
jgi:hypothetical protein